MKQHFATATATALALLTWIALALQFYSTIQWSSARGGGLLEAAWMYFAFFTVLTNLLVAFVLTIPLVFPQSRIGRWCDRPAVITAVAANIALVCIAYNLLLRNIWNPQGVQLVADVLLHDVIPVAYVGYWLLRVPRDALKWRDVFPVTLYPIAYFCYEFVRGAYSGFYPYPFLNVEQLGYARVLANAIAILVGLIVIALVLIAVKRERRALPAAASP